MNSRENAMSSLNERLQEVQADLRTIGLRHNFREQKQEGTRLHLLEDHVAMIARALNILIEAHEKGAL